MQNRQALRLREWIVLRFWGEDIIKHTKECVKAVEEAIFEFKMNNAYDHFDEMA